MGKELKITDIIQAYLDLIPWGEGVLIPMIVCSKLMTCSNHITIRILLSCIIATVGPSIGYFFDETCTILEKKNLLTGKKHLYKVWG